MLSHRVPSTSQAANRCCMRHRSLRHGFTLVELLVVIAIIGTLVGLLLPAVQSARESARRSSCQNRLKQIGLAVHQHHDARGRLPPSGAADAKPFGTHPTGAWGSSWLVYLLPFMEEQQLYNSWKFDGSGYGIFPLAAYGMAMPGLRCPSSNLPQSRSFDTNNVARSSYVPICGAANGLITSPAYTDSSRVNTSGSGGSTNAYNGMLFPNSQLKFKDCTDGTSKAMIIGEQSDFLTDTSGVKQPWQSSGSFGWTLGTPHNLPDQDSYNRTTIRHPINQKSGWDGTTLGVGVGTAGNIPLNSAHPGGVQSLLLDGAVRFLTDETTMQTLAQLAIRDDGGTVAAE
jgi:prepilin-type N-terminal cleavage/methylation domain-containing protein